MLKNNNKQLIKQQEFLNDFYSVLPYWSRYFGGDTKKINNFCNIKPKHYFDDIHFSRSTAYLSIGIWLTIISLTIACKQYAFVKQYYWILGVIIFGYYVCTWLHELAIDVQVYFRFNKKVSGAVSFGFLLFIVSEIFFFAGFFWTYFDRLFDPSALSGHNSLPYGLEPLFKNPKPYYATIVLIGSGFCANLAYYYIRYGYWLFAVSMSLTAIILGAIFLVIQVIEYGHLLFHIGDSVYASCFFLLTGFHGAHVIIGLFFLIIAHDRLYHCKNSKQRYNGYMLALIYWHFVDYIWIFLVFSIYVLNWHYGYYFTWDYLD